MTALDIKKLRVEIIQVQASKAGLELRIEERLDEIERLKEHIALSDAKVLELQQKIHEGERK